MHDGSMNQCQQIISRFAEFAETKARDLLVLTRGTQSFAPLKRGVPKIAALCPTPGL